MKFSTWLRNWKRSLECQSARKQSRRRESRVRRMVPRPRLEVLEDRLAPATLTVNSTADTVSGTTPTLDLREAILLFNSGGTATDSLGNSLATAKTTQIDTSSGGFGTNDTIKFNIPTTDSGYNNTTGAFTIQPLSTLPAITDPMIINGYSQPGTNANTLTNGETAKLAIVLNGANLPGTDYVASAGLVINASNSTVEGLVINGFGGSQIYATGNNDTFQGNFIGTDVSGTTTPFTPNLAQNSASDHAGIQITGAANVIGTNGDGVNDPAERNVIAGENYGVVLRSTSNSVVAGNFIGTDASGKNHLPNWVGIGTLLGANGDRIGTNGTDADVVGEGNIISGNAVGIAFGVGGTIPSETNGLVAGNSIGLDVNGNPLGNTRAGIFVGFNSSAITIGGNLANLANTIANTQSGPGVWIVNLRGSPTAIRIQGNSIHDNGGLGIDLGGNYPTPPTAPLANDSAGHVGPNNFQNFPILTAAQFGSSVLVSGTLNSAANTQYTVDVYASPTADPTGYGQGQYYLGATTVNTDNYGYSSFTANFSAASLPGGVVPAGWAVSATATDPNGNTSEFGPDLSASSLFVTVNRPTVSAWNGATASDSGTWTDTAPGAAVTLTASTGMVVQNSNGTWNWSYTAPTGAPQPATVFIRATDTVGNSAMNAIRLNSFNVFTVTNTRDDGSTGSLRWAVSQVNADPTDSASNPDVIDFNIPWNDPGHLYYQGQVSLADVAAVPSNTTSDADLANASVVGSGNTIAPTWANSWWSIQLQSHLVFRQPVAIDGYIQPGSSPNTSATGDNAVLRIQINGSQTPGGWSNPYFYSSPGIEFPASNSTVTGIVFNGFDTPDPSTGFPSGTNGAHAVDAAINAYGATNDVFAGNFFGTDVSGTLAVPNWAAIWLYNNNHVGGVNNRIGADSSQDYADRNIISGNAFAGVELLFNGTEDNLVAGNLIGTDRYGNPLGNGAVGVTAFWGAQFNQIGGEGGLGNVIAYNGWNAQYWGLPAGGPGVFIGDANFTQQQYYGTTFNPSIGNSIEGNAIYGNSGLGIGMANSYWDTTGAITGIVESFLTTPTWWVEATNDSQGHSGPNNWQNYPVLALASSSSTDTSVTGRFNEAAEPNTILTLDFYANPSADPSGYGQGQTWLGSTTVTTDANGNVAFTADLAVGNLAGQWITATATDPSGNTSEFALDVQATAAPSQTYAAYLQAALPQSSSTANSMTIQASASIAPATVISALNGLTNIMQPVTVILDLGGGTYSTGGVSYNPTDPNTNANVNFVVQNGTLDPTYPALTVAGGHVSVLHCTLTTSGNAPTLLVTGGSVTLRSDVIIQTSTVYTDPAIAVSGGSTVDLGTAASPGGNTVRVNGTSQVVVSTGVNLVSTAGDIFQVSGGTATPSANVGLASSVNPSLLNQSVTFTATVTAATTGAGIPTGSVTFVDTTTGTTLGTGTLSSGSAILKTSALAVGTNKILAVYSGDKNFITSYSTMTQNVQYHFSGFLPPLGNGLAFAVNRTIPVKFTLSDYNGNAITSLSAVSSLQIQALDANGNPVGAPFNPTSTNNQGLQFSGGQYQFTWQTKGLAAGSYEIVLKLADGTTQTKSIKLTAGGSSAGLVTDGTGGTTTAGALLGGEVDLYVDNSNGDLSSDELARIQDAVTSMDATIAPYGVTIVAVSDPTQANVTLNMNTTSSLGGAAQGVLGCTTDADQVTMIQGWNWYAGSDPTQVGSGEYDFETAVMHELGHVLGLGHSSNSTSVMYASLAPGTANRALVTADLNVSDDGGGPCALHAGPAATVNSPSTSVPLGGLTPPAQSGNPLSVMDQVFADFALLLSDVRDAYQSELSSMSALWQSADALAVQRLDALLSMQAGAMGMSKDSLMRDFIFASRFSSNG